MRPILLSFLLLFAACQTQPPPQPTSDPTKEPWYAQTLSRLQHINREARTAYENGDRQLAGKRVQEGQPLASKLLTIPRPTLEAVEAASDLDQLYGEMLLSNRHYGYARQFFQKNVARWKNWRPQTPETERRRKLAEAGIIEVDKHY